MLLLAMPAAAVVGVSTVPLRLVESIAYCCLELHFVAVGLNE